MIYNYKENDNKILPIRQAIYAKKNGYELPVNIYTPLVKNDKNDACIILVHGGGFGSNLKRGQIWNGFWMRHQAKYFSSIGYTAFEITYRSIGEADITLREISEDVHDAMRFIKEALMPQYGIKRSALIGDSAGSYLSLLLCFDSSPIYHPDAAVLCNAPVDAVNHSKTSFDSRSASKLTDEHELRSLSPIHNVHANGIKYLFIHGNADESVDYNDSVRIYEKLKEEKAQCELLTIGGAGHAFILYGWYDRNDVSLVQTTNYAMSYIEKYLEKTLLKFYNNLQN